MIHLTKSIYSLSKKKILIEFFIQKTSIIFCFFRKGSRASGGNLKWAVCFGHYSNERLGSLSTCDQPGELAIAGCSLDNWFSHISLFFLRSVEGPPYLQTYFFTSIPCSTPCSTHIYHVTATINATTTTSSATPQRCLSVLKELYSCF